jgi:hypothetical protein
MLASSSIISSTAINLSPNSTESLVHRRLY